MKKIIRIRFRQIISAIFWSNYSNYFNFFPIPQNCKLCDMAIVLNSL